MRILVTGGAGYIGSHVSRELQRAGHLPVVLDSLSRGHKWAVRWGPLAEIDLANTEAVRNVLEQYRIDAVIHLAAFAYVGESNSKPGEYFRNNFTNSQSLLDAMRMAGVSRVIFSSTCATYGDPHHLPMTEAHPQSPTNAYGESKRMVERMLEWYQRAHGLQWTALRYFNAAGADASCEIGEVHSPEPHLIPRAIAAARGHLAHLDVFGTDYPTPDGTAVRDYIHVTDLAQAHVRAVERLAAGGAPIAVNLGTGTGHSVAQVIAAVENEASAILPVRYGPRRAGDPAILVADPSRAAVELGWTPQHSSLENIVHTAYQWYLYFGENRGALQLSELALAST